ncbi:MAG: hypothetical protein OXI86_19550 [Candidatus Poribacteria bacterium]|nr:hypothetical protein [Candidatus Poribacteria bacterium]
MVKRRVLSGVSVACLGGFFNGWKFFKTLGEAVKSDEWGVESREEGKGEKTGKREERKVGREEGVKTWQGVHGVAGCGDCLNYDLCDFWIGRIRGEARRQGWEGMCGFLVGGAVGIV